MCSCDQLRKLVAQVWPVGRMSLEPCNGPQDLVTVSLCIQNAINKMHLCSLSITYACPYHNPTATMGHSIHNVDFSKPLTHTTPYTLSAICPVQCKNRDSSVKRTPLQSARRHRMWAFAHSSRLRWRTAVRSRPRWGQRACRWASLRWFLTVCAEILWLCKPIVAAAVRVAGLRRSWRWRCWMWRSLAGVVTRGLRLWGRLDVLPNSLKRLWRQLMVEKWTFNSRATALVDIPAVSNRIYFRDILLIIISRGANNCGQHELEKAFISQWVPPPLSIVLLQW